MKSEKKKTVTGGSSDIISSLPDELICHILSFLPTKQAASTSVLAKRWKLLFAFVPNLDFDDSLYFNPDTTREERLRNCASFTHFVDNVLALQGKLKAPLNRFHLKCKHGVSNYSVLHWISEALKRDVLDLYISFSGYCVYPLPFSIFVSKTLVTLKIQFEERVRIDMNRDVSLPKLKTLHVYYFRMKTNTFNKLLSGCPALEDLVLVNLMWYKYSVFEHIPVILSIPTLKRLKFCRSQEFRKRFEPIEGVSMSFDNPNLVYLEYFDDIVDRFEQLSFESLVEAKLRLRNKPDQTQTYKITVTKLFMGIRNVKILYLSDDTLKVLACCCEAIPVFDNLIELTIKISTYVEWELLPYLLKSCPSLQTLVFEEVYCENDNVWRRVKMDVCTCLSSSPVKVLKILNLGKYNGARCPCDDPDRYCHGDHVIQDQIQCVELFLKTIPNLEQVILHYNTSDDEDVMEVFKKLEKVPRVASGNCNVQLKSNNLSLASTSTKRGTLL